MLFPLVASRFHMLMNIYASVSCVENDDKAELIVTFMGPSGWEKYDNEEHE